MAVWLDNDIRYFAFLIKWEISGVKVYGHQRELSAESINDDPVNWPGARLSPVFLQQASQG